MVIAASTPTHLRVHLTHALLQYVADQHGVDVLHVKGPALHPELLQRGRDGEPRPRRSSDADVLVRPGDAQRYLWALERVGCEMRTTFTTGSPFEHAATLWNDSLGYADIHRFFPGIDLKPDRAFEQLWARRDSVEIAHRPLSVPCLEDQRLIILLHSARSGAQDTADMRRAWNDASRAEQAGVRKRAEELRATVALAAAIGELDEFRSHPSFQLWDQFSRHPDHSRSDEWKARIRAARTPGQKLSLMARSLQVNTDRMALDLGREPTAAEVREAYRERFTRAWRESRRDRGAR